MQTSLENQKLRGDEMVEMFINKKAEFPDKTNYEMKASASLGYGLIKTVSPKNELYCIEEDCQYFVTILVSNIESVFFFPTIFANNSKIKFHHSMKLLEELEPQELVSYEVEVPRIEGNWVFTIIPAENKPQFYINPDIKPDSLEKYKYKGTSSGPQEIMITRVEADQFKFSYQNFFITYHSENPELPATFRFEIKRLEPTERKYLRPNFKQFGLAANNEVVNYFLDLRSIESKSYSIVLQLSSLKGKADLFVKECGKNEFSCHLTSKDINNFYSGNLDYFKDKIFRYSDQPIQKDNMNVDQILLNVNCYNSGLFQKQDELVKHFPYSRSCVFVVGIFVKQNEDQIGLPYQLTTRGEDIVKKLNVNENLNLTLTENEKMFYKIELTKRDLLQYSELVFKSFVISGKIEIYFSYSNQKPNKDDFDGKLKLEQKNQMSIHCQTKEITLQLNRMNEFNQIYFAIYGQEYTVMEIITSFNNGLQKTDEKLKIGKLINREITDKNFLIIENQHYFYSNFQFQFPKISKHLKFLSIQISSHALSLEICVQLNKRKFDQNLKCDFSSLDDNLQIDYDANLFKENNFLAISIRRKTQPSENYINFPIPFTIHLSSNQIYTSLTLHKPGHVHSMTIPSKQTIFYSINITKMQYQLLMVLQSESHDIKADLFWDHKYKIKFDELDYENFALVLNDDDSVKEQYCRGRKSCFIYLQILNSGDSLSSFSFYYTYDQVPVFLKEGQEIFAPSPLPQYFVFQHTNNKPLSFNFQSDVTSLEALGKILDSDNFDQYSVDQYLQEQKFDFKTNIDKKSQIVVPSNYISNFKSPVGIFLTIPKFDFEYPQAKVVLYDRTGLLRVVAHTGIQKLRAFKQTEGKVEKGDFVYYSVNLKKEKKFSVFLSQISGTTKLYINPGYYNLTTTNNYWKKSSVKNGEEFVIKKKMMKKMPKNFTIGVYGDEKSKFSLIFMPNFKNIIELEFQKLTDMSLKHKKTYYFDLYNKKPQFNSILYAEGSDVEVAVLEYNQKKNQNFFEVLKNDENYLQKFVFKKGDIPRKKFSEKVLDINSHYVIRMKPLDANANINFLIYDKEKPIKGYMEKRFHFALKKEDSQIFEIDLDSEYKEVDVNVKLKFGNIEFSVSDSQTEFNDYVKITKTSQKSKKVFMDKNKIVKSNDIIIFNTIYIKVKSWQLSEFSILVKPFDKFQQLVADESELVFTHPSKDIYLYYDLTKENLKKIHSLTIDLYTEQYYTNKPELLFISEQDLTLNKDSPFLPLQVEDYLESTIGEQKHFLIKPKLMKGNIVIKINKSEEGLKVPIKVLLSINNHKHLEVNGIYKGKLSEITKSEKFTMYLPSAGEFRILPDSCQQIEISFAHFTNNQNSEEIHFTDKYNQAYPFLSVDETQKKIKRKFRVMELSIRRGIVNSSGVLDFQINKKDSFKDDQEFYLISEFRPERKSLIMKDYIDLFQSDKSFNAIVFNYSYINGRLKINSQLPKFREQLFKDYPKIKKIVVRFKIYLFSDSTLQDKLKKCGFGAIENTFYIFHQLERVLSLEDLNKPNLNINFFFTKQELKTFSNPTIDIFVRLGITFIENEEDEFNVSLNKKFTDIPYFFLTLNNNYYTSWYSYLLIISLISVIVIGLYCMIKKQQKVDYSNINNIQYQRGDQKSESKLEMRNL